MTLRRAMLASVLSFLVVVVPSLAFADTVYYPSSWNGFKIYLSPSSQTTNIGCDNYNEATGASNISHEAASGIGTDLVNRGYKVRVGSGSPTANVGNSNTWGSNRHIAIHSNAPGPTTPWDCTPPYDCTNGGTKAFYVSSTGKNLAYYLEERLDGESPGCVDNISYNALYELTDTNMPAAYLEAEFHTYRPGVDWLRDYNDATIHWTDLIGHAVDLHLGYP